MLSHLSIRNIVLIDKLDLEIQGGLSVLTGETGAGKSILLDALGLVLGQRAEQGLVREGSDQGIVSAGFLVPIDHPLRETLAEMGVDADDEEILLRRSLKGGKSRAFINDQPVSQSLLRDTGNVLIEIHGQHGQQGLMDARNHRALLDLHGRLDSKVTATATAWQALQDARQQLQALEDSVAAVRADEDYLRHAVGELDVLAPQVGEEDELAEARSLMMHGEQVAEEIKEAMESLVAHRGAENGLRLALRRIERVAEKASGRLDPVADALAKAYNELNEAVATLEAAQHELDYDPQRLEEAEERLFALRAAARKYNCQVDQLPEVQEQMTRQIAALESGEAGLAEAREACIAAEKAFKAAAGALSAARQKAAGVLDKAVNAELPALKLEKATFQTNLQTLPEEQWGRHGAEQVTFEVSTNPGAAMGPLSKIASGGELSRFSLALKVVLAQTASIPTMIFDEIDQGIGGAVADAVGERLVRLAETAQILVVTHSPQVASRGAHHLQVGKQVKGGATFTCVDLLDGEKRMEEIARMLAGATITDEARAAAQQLIEAGVA